MIYIAFAILLVASFIFGYHYRQVVEWSKVIVKNTKKEEIKKSSIIDTKSAAEMEWERQQELMKQINPDAFDE